MILLIVDETGDNRRSNTTSYYIVNSEHTNRGNQFASQKVGIRSFHKSQQLECRLTNRKYHESKPWHKAPSCNSQVLNCFAYGR